MYVHGIIRSKLVKRGVLAILGVPKMALPVTESIQTSPQNPQKATLGTKIGPRKVIFEHLEFSDILMSFPF